MWIPRIGTDFCLQLCLSLWYGFCHALLVILVCLFAVYVFLAEIPARLVVLSYGYPQNTNDFRFWPKFRPASQNGICTQWFDMQSNAGRNFGQVIRISCQAVRFGPFLVDLCLLFAIWELSPS